MSRLVVPQIECTESSENFGRFVAQPLEKGFGVTLGNSLRRVLLSYLPGAAVTRVRIEGIQHEFSSMPHVKEDVPEFLLNLKELRLIPVSGEEGVLTLEVSGEGRVSAADIKGSTDFEVANPELHLLTMDSADARVHVEMDVEIGEGYRQAEPIGNLPVGTIPLDAIFTPIRKVNYSVAPIHVGKESSRQQLFLEVWSDGTLSPAEAVSRSAAILAEQFRPFVDYISMEQQKEEEQAVPLDIPEGQYNMSVDQMNLSVRTMNCLRRGGIETVGQLISQSEKDLLALRNFGQKSMLELKERLDDMGLSMKVDEASNADADAEPESAAEEVEEAEEVKGEA